MTKAANSLRGEAHLLIGERNFLLRPTFENLLAAEEEIGSLFAVVDRASEGLLTLQETTALLWHCIADVERPPREMVGQAVLALGLIAATKPVRAILSQVLKGQS